MTLLDWKARVILGVILLQFIVPLVALVASKPPTRFGFQMYSGLGGSNVEVRDGDGELIPYDWRNVIASLPRADLDWPNSGLPSRICQEVPKAATVTIRRSDEERLTACP